MNSKTKCFPHHHMTPLQYAIWSVCRALSHDSGILYLNGPGLARRFSEGSVSKSTIYRAVDALADAGWFRLTKEPVRRRDGQYSPSQFHVLDHDEYIKEHPNMCPSPFPPVGMDDVSPFPSGDEPFPSGDQPFPPMGNNLIEPTYKKSTEEQSDNLGPFPLAGMDDVDELTRRFAKGRRQAQRRSAAAPVLERPPFPPAGMDVPSTPTSEQRAGWMSDSVASMVSITADQKEEWRTGLKQLLDRGHQPAKINEIIHFAHKQIPAFKREGGIKFAQCFEGMIRMQEKMRAEGKIQ